MLLLYALSVGLVALQSGGLGVPAGRATSPGLLLEGTCRLLLLLVTAEGLEMQGICAGRVTTMRGAGTDISPWTTGVFLAVGTPCSQGRKNSDFTARGGEDKSEKIVHQQN